MTRSTDPSERQADRLAEQVMSPSSRSSGSAGVSQGAYPSPDGAMEQSNGSSAIQTGTAALEGGQPLGSLTRSLFEPRFGRDLGGVRIHTAERDGVLARSFSSRAFTTGTDIVFAPGQYVPGTRPAFRVPRPGAFVPPARWPTASISFRVTISPCGRPWGA